MVQLYSNAVAMADMPCLAGFRRRTEAELPPPDHEIIHELGSWWRWDALLECARLGEEYTFLGLVGILVETEYIYPLISKTSANLEEAYNFAKWMAFSTEAYAKEAELTGAIGSAPKLPVSVDASLDLPGHLSISQASIRHSEPGRSNQIDGNRPGYIRRVGKVNRS
jgi:hypothetical protein